MADDLRDREGGFGIYVHWPYCAAKCPYCDFNSHAMRGPVDQGRFRDAINTELTHYAQMTPRREVTSVFFGGGTPSLMNPVTVERILDRIGALWPVAPNVEVTLEANPSSVETERFAGYRAAGVGRVSLGVQSLRDADLRFLGRLHSAQEARTAVTIAQRHFERVSIDLIYARPNQTVADWREELSEGLALRTAHLSAYQLTIEPGTPFHRLFRAGKIAALPEDEAADLFELTEELCASAGLGAYEVSNYAVPGEESRHNLTYWRYGEYVGVGPGAHGRIRSLGGGRTATSAIYDPASWLAAVERDGGGIGEALALTAGQQAEEMLLMGLRLSEGVRLARLEQLTGYTIPDSAIRPLEDMGLIEFGANGHIRAASRGRLLLNQIVLRLAGALSPLERADKRIASARQPGGRPSPQYS